MNSSLIPVYFSISYSLMSWFHPSPENPPYLIPTSQSSLSQDHDSDCIILCLPSFFAGEVCGFFLSYFHPRMPSDGMNREQRPANYFLPPQNYMNPNTLFYFSSDDLTGPSTYFYRRKSQMSYRTSLE